MPGSRAKELYLAYGKEILVRNHVNYTARAPRMDQQPDVVPVRQPTWLGKMEASDREISTTTIVRSSAHAPAWEL